MDNCIITAEVIKNMPAEDILDARNNEYFNALYEEFINDASQWFKEEEE